MSTVVFNEAAFKAAYPEFSGFPTGTVLPAAFTTATLYLNNTDNSIVQDIPTRTALLFLLTAHVTKLFNGTNDGTPAGTTPPSQLVGRIEIAKEGSVHVRTDMGTVSPTAAWFMQTRYGAAFWTATVKYRTLRYVKGVRSNLPPFVPTWGG